MLADNPRHQQRRSNRIPNGTAEMRWPVRDTANRAYFTAQGHNGVKHRPRFVRVAPGWRCGTSGTIRDRGLVRGPGRYSARPTIGTTLKGA